VFFFDEAHLLFKGAPRAFLDKIEQVVRLIRSKGVGVYFVTQNPLDVPDEVLGQLGNRIQHALRAFTPRDQKAVRAAADTFRANPAFNAADAIKELGVGEALVSTLGGKGTPGIVERTLIRPPSSRLGPATRAERNAVIEESMLGKRYDKSVDQHSAYEMLKERAEKAAHAEEQVVAEKKTKSKTTSRRSNRQGVMEAMVKSVVRSMGSSLGRKIARGILGSLMKG
jgi:DNA helicase HerA-like ATPase